MIMKCLTYIDCKIAKRRGDWQSIIDKFSCQYIYNNELPASLYFDIGLALCKMRHWDKAIAPLESAIALHPDKLSWKFRLSLALGNVGRYQESSLIIDSIFQNNGSDHHRHYLCGKLLLGYSRPVQAERFFRRAIEIDGDKYKYLLHLIIALHKQGRDRTWQLVEVIEKIISIKPRSVHLLCALGVQYEKLNNYNLATIIYLKSLTCSPKNEQVLLYKKISELKEQQSVIRKNENEKLIRKEYSEAVIDIYSLPENAEQKLRRIIECDNDGTYYSALAKVLNTQGEAKLWQERDVLETIVSFGEVIPKQYFRLGVIYEKMNNFLRASNFYHDAIHAGMKTSEIYYRLGYCLEMSGEDDAANIFYEQTIDYDNDSKLKNFGIGVLHNKFGRKSLAIKYFLKKSENSPCDSELLYKIGMAYDRQYNWKLARHFYKSALRIDATNANVLYRLGFVYERQHVFEEAREWYEKAIRVHRAPSAYWFWRLGMACYQAAQYRQACQSFITYAEKKQFHNYVFSSPLNRCDALYLQALNCEEHGNAREAIFFLKEAILHRRDEGEKLYFHLGYLLYKIGKYKESVIEFLKMRVLIEPHGVSDKKYQNDENVRKLNDYNFYYKNSKVEDYFIVYESFQGNGISCNPLALFLAIYKDEHFKDYKHFWIINSEDCIPSWISEYRNVYFVNRNSNHYLELLATAKILVNNSTFPYFFIKKDNQVYINTWHGTPLKTLGKDMKGRFLEHKNFTRNILQSDILVSPNNYTTKILSDSHEINGIYNGQILESGYPRIDLTLSLSSERKYEIYRLLGLRENTKIIFYAPTWRGTHAGATFDSDKLLSDLNLLRQINGCTLVFRGHSLIEAMLADIVLPGVILLPKSVDTNEFLALTDVLITDYSSVLFDFFPCRRPIFYYTYDLEEYNQERGLYLDISTLPGKQCSTIDHLVQEIKYTIDHNLFYAFNDSGSKYHFNEYDDGHASGRVIAALLKKLKKKAKPEFKNKKNKLNLLFYSGPFMRNGITTSFINLANNLVSTGHVVSVVVDPNPIAKSPERLEQISKLDSRVNIIGRVGGMNLSIEERYVHAERNRDYDLTNDEMFNCWKESWRTEYKRIFGNAKFDAIINFEGYSIFWASLFSCQDHIHHVIFQHNDMYGEFSSKYPYLLGVFNTYKDYQRVISVSKDTRNLNVYNLQKIIDLDESKFVYSENLLNLDTIFEKALESVEEQDEILFNQSGPVFINIGRMSLEKDQAKLLNAFSQVLEKVPNARLIILGEGPLKSDLIKQSQKLDIQQSVFFLGHRLNPYSYLERADCFVLSSNHEGQPMTLLEALALDKSIIATNIAGNNSVLGLINEVGVENSVDGLSYAMIHFAQHGKQQNKFDYANYQYNALKCFLKFARK